MMILLNKDKHMSDFLMRIIIASDNLNIDITGIYEDIIIKQIHFTFTVSVGRVGRYTQRTTNMQN